jgi:hypothetical protein
MTTITNNLTATRKCNASVIDRMFENAFFAYRRSEVSNSLQADAQFGAIVECIAMLVKESKQAVRNAVINAYEESVAAQKAEEERKAEEQRKQAEAKADYPTDDRMFQLQTSMTRYYDDTHMDYGHDRTRNYKTIESAIRSAKKELKRNDLPKAVRSYHEQYGPRQCDYHIHSFAEDGHEFSYEEEHEFWHIDGVRIVDRLTQKVLWES